MHSDNAEAKLWRGRRPSLSRHDHYDSPDETSQILTLKHLSTDLSATSSEVSTLQRKILALEKQLHDEVLANERLSQKLIATEAKLSVHSQEIARSEKIDMAPPPPPPRANDTDFVPSLHAVKSRGKRSVVSKLFPPTSPPPPASFAIKTPPPPPPRMFGTSADS